MTGMTGTSDKMSDMGDAARERYNMLMSRAQEGTITEGERMELDRLRPRFEAVE